LSGIDIDSKYNAPKTTHLPNLVTPLALLL